MSKNTNIYLKRSTMKKVFCFLVSLLFLSPAFALNSQVKEIIADTTFNAVTTTTTGAIDISNAERVSFFAHYNETEVGNSISGAVTVHISYDNSTWLQASFYDYAGGATLQTSETISADGDYYFWFNKDLAVPYVRVTLTATNTDADDLLIMNTQIFTQQ